MAHGLADALYNLDEINRVANVPDSRLILTSLTRKKRGELNEHRALRDTEILEIAINSIAVVGDTTVPTSRRILVIARVNRLFARQRIRNHSDFHSLFTSRERQARDSTSVDDVV
ncbi:hypothetical protein ALC57_13327 [Trachymyrmex cornetzi]|uniref:Uncharacterized protein n=1 Tax=Trachymyrmex cornetzi TaxID=471704 RepID=A0A151IZE9_9HYME|nr:hypothetical protein ALC57_13327 [Trachymyrmex cornetzi]